MDEASIKRALGEVLASELKVLTEAVSVLPSMQQDIRELKDGQERMQVDIDVLKVTARNHSQQLVELKTDVKVLKEDVSVLKTDVKVLKTDVKVLKEDVKVLKEDVSGLKTSMSRVEEVVEVHSAEIKDLQQRAS